VDPKDSLPTAKTVRRLLRELADQGDPWAARMTGPADDAPLVKIQYALSVVRHRTDARRRETLAQEALAAAFEGLVYVSRRGPTEAP
jgi:hypothetical protein